jgi:hypothetical protein
LIEEEERAATEATDATDAADGSGEPGPVPAGPDVASVEAG